MELQGCWICPRVTGGPGFLVGVGPYLHGKQEGAGVSVTAGVQPRWIQGDSKVGGWSRRLWKNTYLITDIERLEMDSVVRRLVEKRRLNNLGYVE